MSGKYTIEQKVAMVIEGGSKALGESSRGNEYQREIDDLKRLVGDQAEMFLASLDKS